MQPSVSSMPARNLGSGVFARHLDQPGRCRALIPDELLGRVPRATTCTAADRTPISASTHVVVSLRSGRSVRLWRVPTRQRRRTAPVRCGFQCGESPSRRCDRGPAAQVVHEMLITRTT